MSTYRPTRRRRSLASRAAEGTAVGLLVTILGLLWIVLYVVLSAAPFVILALVLHWLGAF